MYAIIETIFRESLIAALDIPKLLFKPFEIHKFEITLESTDMTIIIIKDKFEDDEANYVYMSKMQILWREHIWSFAFGSDTFGEEYERCSHRVSDDCVTDILNFRFSEINSFGYYGIDRAQLSETRMWQIKDLSFELYDAECYYFRLCTKIEMLRRMLQWIRYYDGNSNPTKSTVTRFFSKKIEYNFLSTLMHVCPNLERVFLHAICKKLVKIEEFKHRDHAWYVIRPTFGLSFFLKFFSVPDGFTVREFSWKTVDITEFNVTPSLDESQFVNI